jgi:hypothetical protein
MAAPVDGVVVLLDPSQIRLGEGRLGTFLGLVYSPIKSIDINMILAAACVGLAHVALRVAAENVPGLGIKAPISFSVSVPETPGVIGAATEIDFVERVDPLVSEQGIIQTRLAVIGAV